MNDLEPAAAVEEALRGNGISVESVSLDDAVSLTYLTAFLDIEPDHGKVGCAVMPFLKHARDDEFEPRTIEATVLRNEGGAQATWTLEVDWIRVCNGYTLGNKELSQRVLDSLCKEGDA